MEFCDLRGKSMKKYKAVLFDLDGTLNESGVGIMRCVQYALEKMGKPEPDLDRLRVFVGPPLKWQFMSYAGFTEEEGEEAVRFFRERYNRVGIYENSVYDGVEDMLKSLKEAGFILAVASSKPEVFVKQILEYFHLDHYFAEIAGSDLDYVRSKKGQVIEEALRRMNLLENRQQVLMVGDKDLDVYGAREAGMDCVAVTWGYGTAEELDAAQPLVKIDYPLQLIDYLGRN